MYLNSAISEKIPLSIEEENLNDILNEAKVTPRDKIQCVQNFMKLHLDFLFQSFQKIFKNFLFLID